MSMGSASEEGISMQGMLPLEPFGWQMGEHHCLREARLSHSHWQSVNAIGKARDEDVLHFIRVVLCFPIVR